MLQEQLFYFSAHLSFIAPEESSYHGSSKLKFDNSEYPKPPCKLPEVQEVKLKKVLPLARSTVIVNEDIV